MRVAILTNEYVSEEANFDGGIANHLAKIALVLKEMGHEPLVFVGSTKSEKIFHQGVEVHRVSFKINWFYKLLDKLSSFQYQTLLNVLWESYYLRRQIKAIHKQEKIDLILFTSFKSLGILRPRNIPSLMLLAGSVELWDKANGVEYKRFRDKQFLLLEKYDLKFTKNIYAPSYFLSKEIGKRFNKSIDVIETPYLPQFKDPDNSKLSEVQKKFGNKPYLIFFGRIALFKGAIDIADLLEDLFNQNQDINFLFVGKDLGYKGKSTVDYIREKVSNYSDRIEIIEQVHHNQLFPLIKNAKAVVIPSRIENLSNASIESLALGKAIVASKNVSFEQVITEGENGFLANHSNPKELLVAIQELLKLDESQLKKLEEKSLQIVDRFHPSITVGNLVKKMEEILGKR
jgi:glycosyltransferase involved in cell wall biosynthesis